jgi:hypothetical protein
VRVAAVAWCTLSIYWAALPRWWLRAALAGAFAAASLGALAALPDRLATGAVAAAVAAVVACWALVPLFTERRYSPESAKLASATFFQDQVTVHDVRDFTYRTAADFDAHYEDRTYDLGAARTLDLVVSYFGAGSAVAHTFLSFGFEGGRYLAVSIEARRLQHDVFHPKKALFKRYELMYVWGDERDLIGLRTNHRGEHVYLYRTVATESATRQLLVDMLQRTNELTRQPVFYSVLRRNCTTMIVRHLNRTRLTGKPYRRRILMTGYADHYAHEDGLLAIEGDFAAAKQRARIDDRARAAGRAADFSRRIRTHIAG